MKRKDVVNATKLRLGNLNKHQNIIVGYYINLHVSKVLSYFECLLAP